MKKKVLILGSTGSIGRATLEVIENQQDTFEVFGLACKENMELLNVQIEKFKPAYVGIYNEQVKEKVCFDRARVFTGIEGIKEMVGMDAEIVVNALPGSIGLEPTIEALKCNKILALANKESLVMAGRIISKLLKEGTARLIPVDSEHSALFQLMQTIDRKELKTIMITASGGPFRDHEKEALEGVKPEEALNHPTWKMGTKVTLDSATLMNKGLEVIEARWLFDIKPSQIKVLIHPESILHGIIELVDDSFITYMSYPDMKIPISFALNEGKRRPLPFNKLNVEDFFKLTFYPPDTDRFPSLRLAYEALNIGDSALIVLNASNELATFAFAEGKIKFTDIPALVEAVLDAHPHVPVIEDVTTIYEIHEWAKRHVTDLLRGFNG